MHSTVKRQITPPVFEPVVLTITIETKEELDALGSLFNSGIIADVHRKMGIDQHVWQALQTVDADLDPTDFEALLKAEVKKLLK